MLSEVAFESAQTEWAEPIVFAEKKKRSRLCFRVRFWNFNAVTKRDGYPVPCVDKCFDLPCKAAFFNATCKRGWKVEIEIEACEKKTLTLPHGFTALCGCLLANEMLQVRSKKWWASAFQWLNDSSSWSSSTKLWSSHALYETHSSW